MTLPFEPRPDSPDADHLNTLLDAMRSGTRAPDEASPEPTEAAALANAADQLRGRVRRANAPAAAYLDEHPLHDRWEDIMTTAFPAAPAHAPTGGAFRPSTPVSNRTRKLAEPPISSRLNTWVSAAIVAVMLLGTVGGAWWFGPGRGDPGDDQVRLAAITQDDSTPEGTWPEPLTPEEAPWIAPISADECVAEPMPLSEYADALTTDPGPLNRSYEIIGPADPDDAEAAVATIRGLEACAIAGPERSGNWRSLYTDAGLFYLGATADNADTWEEVMQMRLDTGLQWSEWAEQEGTDPVALVSGVEPDWIQAREMWRQAEDRTVLLGEYDSTWAYWEWRYNPDDAYILADGRMMVHGTVLYWADDPIVQEQGLAEKPNVIVMAYVLKNVDGQWLIDEQNIQMCFNDACDQLRDAVDTPAASPIATSEG